MPDINRGNSDSSPIHCSLASSFEPETGGSGPRWSSFCHPLCVLPRNRDTVHRLENQSGSEPKTDNRGVEKTSAAIKILKQVGAYPDAVKAKDSHAIRPGKGKMRNRRYISRKGPLIVYGSKGSKIVKAFRNIPSVEFASVEVANGREEEEYFSPPLVPLE
uniref:Uncharacterized protein n=1 Tax=Nelumbo nucifera TaxID=4432 RepID=A0A822YFD1_NELNU|nr:TPA_asm: hypothetical protein HUJ06_031184 [Nelumbo nucifera]